MNMKMPLIALFIVSIMAVSAMAFGMGFHGMKAKGPESQAVQQALDSGNFVAWKAAVVTAAQARVDTMTEEDFQKMVEKHKEMAQKHADMEAKMAPIKSAMENGDYTAWKAAVESSGMPSKMTEKITAENFAQFVEMHKAMKSGDFEKVKELKQQLGLEFGMKKGFGKERGFGFRGQKSQ